MTKVIEQRNGTDILRVSFSVPVEQIPSLEWIKRVEGHSSYQALLNAALEHFFNEAVKNEIERRELIQRIPGHPEYKSEK